MKQISDQQSNNVVKPLSPGRRTFVKGIAAMGAGVAAFPLLTTTAEAKALVVDSRFPSESSGAVGALQVPLTFQGDKIDWHGFDRYDFVMDMQNQAITPFKAPAGEESGSLGNSAPGQLRCVVVVPKQAAPGNPWSWRGVYWNHQPQAEVELLKRGFHVAYISVDPKPRAAMELAMDERMDELGMSPRALSEWDAWYAFLTNQYGLSKKPVFVGMSRGGIFEYSWCTANPSKVSGIYADNPAMERPAFQRLRTLARADVPILQVCGTLDPLLGTYASAIEAIYQQFGGRVSMMIKKATPIIRIASATPSRLRTLSNRAYRRSGSLRRPLSATTSLEPPTTAWKVFTEITPMKTPTSPAAVPCFLPATTATNSVCAARRRPPR